MDLAIADANITRSVRDDAAPAPQIGVGRAAAPAAPSGLLARARAAIHRLVATRTTLDHPAAIGASDRELARLNHPAWSIRDERERAARLANLRRPM